MPLSSALKALRVWNRSKLQILVLKRDLTTGTRLKQARPNQPVKFSGSDAQFNAVQSFLPPKTMAPWYQTRCVVVSVAVFMIYFLILRESNDIDEYLEKDVFFYIDPVGEAKKLKKKIAIDEARGRDTTELKAKLEKLVTLVDQKRGDYTALESSLQRIKAEKEAAEMSKD